MKLIRFYKVMSLLTAMALIYIHLQMQIYELAYEGKKREKALIELRDFNTMLSYDILKLKSSHHLGGSLLTEKSDFQFYDKEDIVQVMTSEPLGETKTLAGKKQNNQMISFMSFLPFRPQAEAEARAASTSQ